jgi:exopolysaccharide biosynthesis polyprenyl glycosylphosphotransferase
LTKKNTVFALILFDFIASIIAWFFFFNFRKLKIENLQNYAVTDTLNSIVFYKGALLVAFFWISLIALHGMYNKVFRKSRLKELVLLFWVVFFGTIILFFVLILDDVLDAHIQYYLSFSYLFLIQFVLLALPKLIITSLIAHKVHNRIIGFNTLVVGCNDRSIQLVQKLNSAKKSAGYKIVGFVSLTHHPKDLEKMKKYAPFLGNVEKLDECILNLNIEELIIAVKPKNISLTHRYLASIKSKDINVKVLPDSFNILSGQIKMSSILHEALIDLNLGKQGTAQAFFKRIFDILVSFLVLIIFSPLYLALSFLVKKSSEGPIFFKQDRVGYRGEVFKIIKFRTMYIDAEKNGPALSKDNDNRITPIGKFLRKARLDELPQFFNVLKGEMSIVGPRPERQFFIDQITAHAPEYYYLHRVKPGITSWGQVKYGYAENVEQMIERLKFDLIYLENMSLIVDLKIMIHTVLVVFQGRGK